ncbi:helix-turn-helix domain-containing protein [Paenibacillus woosongensis]|uniref:Helix-turn-helix domain-containing protein n=1 Tax=Paenibacillus woosongensis TaxID=307580 RepID=A0A7X2Z2J2_9BACL|nr:AraC family transcriptional regulator [Paenibacillus woosongensis]MUG45701.1 helix-turn-helix domain-containing protein [Paenibacillus woosongensis]
MTLPSDHSLPYICKLMWHSFKIPVFYLNEHKKIEIEFPINFAMNPHFSSKNSWLSQICAPHAGHMPILYRTDDSETFISVPVQTDGEFNGTILLGPAAEMKLTDTEIQAFVQKTGTDHNLYGELAAYYRSLPVLSITDCVYAAMHLHYMLYQELLDPADVYTQNRSVTSLSKEIEDPVLTISERRQNTAMHHDALFEQKSMQAIKQGNKDEVIRNWRQLPHYGEVGLLSKTSELRSRKNLAITVITLATRAAVEGGLQYETALTISDLYIQNVEELNDVKAVDHFIEEVLSDYAERVHQTKRNQYSKPINTCLDYIFKHLYDHISLNDLAQKAALHPNYLSALFKREVGYSLREYIQRIKIEEAQSLLLLTDQTISEISALLNYHDQSYFSKMFKKFTGVTPIEYRNKRSVL